jgi:hypothetical protein
VSELDLAPALSETKCRVVPKRRPELAHSADGLMSRAAREVALRLDALSQRGETLGEVAHLQPETRAALRRLQPDPVDDAEETLLLPNWRPRPKGVDALVRWPEGTPRFTLELKLRKTDWMLWDAYKMIDALNLEAVEAAYLLVGASAKDWQARYTHCAQGSKTTELFESGAREHRSDQLFRANAHAWYELLWGGSARPLRVPARIRTIRVENAEMHIDGMLGQLRCVRVEAASKRWLEFSPAWYGGEWPVGVQPCEHYLSWRRIPRQEGA